MVSSGFILCIGNPGETGYCAALSRQYFNAAYRFTVNIRGRQHGISDLCCIVIRDHQHHTEGLQKQQNAPHKIFSFAELVEYVKLQNI